TLAAVGAAIGVTRRAPGGDLARVAAPAAALTLVAALAVPFLADRWAASARAVAASDPATAWARVGTAAALDPWEPTIAESRGRIAEAAGDLDAALRSYQRAASLSRHPWLDEYRAARVLRRANRPAAARAACARAVAGNPAEPALRAGPCSPPV
ncbi:MAG TPA: hypothetical protein VLN26_18340, partial [Gaiellaceae bacterium]|nr:hypothetical protein [Gaiellaceae bacterium]